MKIATITKVALTSTFVLSVQSCDTQQTAVKNNSTGIDAIKEILTSSTDESFSVLENAKSFLTNELIEEALPDELKQVNSTLEGLGLGSVVEKEKQYIADVASSSASIAKPIIESAIKNITLTDAIAIASGGEGAAVEYLKNKTQNQLVAAIQPKVEEQLNANGITSLISNATGSNSTLKSAINLITGNTNSANSNSISKYATEQIVNGMFDVAKDYEINNSSLSTKVINSILERNNSN